MSFVLKYGLSIALAMLLVGCPDDEDEKEGSVTLSIKKIDNVAAGEGDNASVSVEVTIKDGDDKVTGDDAKAEVALKHKCGSADKYSGSGKATAASAVAKPSIDVPRPAADAKDETHKCKIQASAKIGDKDITAESNEFTVGKKDDSGAVEPAEKAELTFGSSDLETGGDNAGKLMVGKQFTVTNEGGADGTVKLEECAGYLLFKVGDNAADIDEIGSAGHTLKKKGATQGNAATFAVVGTGTILDTCKLGGVDSAGTDLVAQATGGITGIEADSNNKLKIVYGATPPEKLFVQKSSTDNWVAAVGTLVASGHTFDSDTKGGNIGYEASDSTAKALAKFVAGGWYYLADTR